MYRYLEQWPRGTQNGWSEKLQGVCHDKDNWFFTQNGILWKFPVTHRLDNKVTSANPEKGILRNKFGWHLGDLDYYNGYLFIPVTDNGPPYMAVFSAKDLSFITKHYMKDTRGDDYDGLGWCAINPRDGRLYTSGKHVNKWGNSVYVYDIDFSAIKKNSVNQTKFLTLYAIMRLHDEKGNELTRDHMQGGCFDNDNYLHINNGLYGKDYGNDKGGISVFRVPDTIKKDQTYYLNRFARSYQSGTFRYQFNGRWQEPEGITYWDLNKDTRAPGISGVLHAIMIDVDVSSADDFYFKHYELAAVPNVAPPAVGKIVEVGATVPTVGRSKSSSPGK